MKPLSPETIAQWSDRKWRLNNLYDITDKHGAVVRFKLNPPQEKLLDELHYLNVILKARQLGFSTLILLMALDCCLFNPNFAAGLVADTLDNAKGLLERVKFAYDRLPDLLKARIPITVDNKEETTFGNGSTIRVGTSLRSGTYNFLHISEYGKICAKFPDKASEIKSGALNTLAKRQLCFIESTAEGRTGDFYDKSQAAEKLHLSQTALGDLDYKFHFFPWYDDVKYSLDDEVKLTPENVAYFRELAELHGITLSDGQKWWYAAKAKEQGDAMWKEYPSTPEEAFKAARDGAYFAKDMLHLRARKKIGQFEPVAGIPVNTFWDLGINDNMSIWLHQQVAGRHRFVGFLENNGEGLAFYFDALDKWRVRRGLRWGEHFGPHDIDKRQDSDTGNLTTRHNIAQSMGWAFRKVERNPVKQNSIHSARAKLPECEFDEIECDKGIKHLENYTKEWNERLGDWSSHPRKDGHDHGADAFFTFTDGFVPPTTFVDKWTQRRAYA
jgi:hypothetical protein